MGKNWDDITVTLQYHEWMQLLSAAQAGSRHYDPDGPISRVLAIVKDGLAKARKEELARMDEATRSWQHQQSRNI